MDMEKIQRLKKWVEESDNIVFFGGAGVSTESGIPDFRGEKGIFKTISEYGVRPETILSHTFFESNKEVFFDYCRKYLIYPDAEPNKAHLGLAKLEKMGKLKAVITQNIDNLHYEAGSKNVLELHGSEFRNYCTKCHKFFSIEDVKWSVGIPRCECGGIIKPDVVLYEEALNEDNIINAVKAIEEADTLVILGTSLSVYPAAGFIQYFRGRNLILINKSQTPADEYADIVIHDDINETFSRL